MVPREPFRVYHEPFLGGGAVFFGLEPSRAVLSDANKELIDVYQAVRDDLSGLIEILRTFRAEQSFYYEIRSRKTAELTNLQRAARFIYLNHTCYNGLYRVNKKGQFNVPYGRYKKPAILNEKVLKAASKALQGARLISGDFSIAAEQAEAGDFVYLDPPYHPLSPTAFFTDYTTGHFGEAQQRKLAAVFRELDRRGCRVMLSNSDVPLMHELYQDFNISRIWVKRTINCDRMRRGAVGEIVVRNYE